MFFDNLEILPSLAEKSGFSIFVIEKNIINSLNPEKKHIKTAPNSAPFSFPSNSFYIAPEKGSIKVDQIRNLESEMLNKETKTKFFIIKHADAMNEQAENAALKLLEEPKENYHLVFLASDLTAFLPTILSRASVYVLKIVSPLEAPPSTDEETLKNAKLLLSSSKKDLMNLVTTWTDKKGKKTREEVLKILSIAIELSYKSYFKTEKSGFLKKLPNLLKTYDNIKGNGHIKLQLVANLC